MADKVDARGLSCPQPAMLTRKTLKDAADGVVTVIVDTMAQVHNCTRTAKDLGWDAEYEEADGAFEVTLRK